MVVTAVEADRARGRAVDAVGADDHVGSDGPAVDAQVRRRAVTEVTLAAARKSAPGLGCTLGQVGIQPAPLGHQDQRRGALPLEPLPVPQAQLERPHGVLHDGTDVERDLADCPVGQPAAAGLVAREARPVDEQDRRACAREPVRGRGSGRPRPDDDGVETLHPGLSLRRRS